MSTTSVILARETTTTPSGVPGRNGATKVLKSIPVNNNRGRTTRKQRQRLNARRDAVAVAAVDDDDDEKSSSKSASFRLILMRHSEAAEEDEEKKKYRRDIDRPLTERGITYAKKLSENLKTICGDEWMPTRIVCSSARRTRETLMAMDLVPTTSMFNDKVSSSSSSTNNNTVVYLGSIYHYAGMDGVFGSHVKQLMIGESETFEGEQTDEVVLIVGHNRGLEEAVREFTGETNVEMNVASLACLRKRKQAKTRETWEQALEEKDDTNDPKKSSLWTLEHLLDPNGQCLDCGWGDVPRG